MVILGNIFLSIAIIAYCFLSCIVISPASGHDWKMGYGLGVLYAAIIFCPCMIFVTIAIAQKGGLVWISSNPLLRYTIATAGLLIILSIIFFSAIFYREEGPIPVSMKYLRGHGALWIPIPLLFASAVLLNDAIRLSVPEAAWKMPLLIVMGISLLSGAELLAGWAKDLQEAESNRLSSLEIQHAAGKADDLKTIKNTAPGTSVVRLLNFTGQYQDRDVREAALAKIKINPGWEQELVRLLENEGPVEVFTFLAANEVNDKEKVAAAINTGIASIGAHFLRNSNQMPYKELFETDTRNILETVDKYKDSGTEYISAIKQLRAALEPLKTRAADTKLNCISMLDRWIRDNS